MNQDLQYIIREYLNSAKGQTPDIDKRFARLFCDKKSVEQLRDSMRKDWEDLAGSESDEDLNPLLYRIHYLINSENIQQNELTTPKGHALWRWYSRIAAVLLLPLMVLAAMFQLRPHQVFSKVSQVKVVAPLGSRIHVDLPDGSSVWLNSGSELAYQLPFAERNLSVRGEAYFDVVTDSLHPLVVEGPRTRIKVLGTQFNVKMWPNEEITEVVLAKGRVEMTPKNYDQTFVMQPGDMIVYNQAENRLSKSRVDPDYYSAWVEGKLVLRNVNMEQVARELSRWFNVDIKVMDPSLKDLIFRATFEDEKLEDVLRLLKMISPIDYSVVDNQQQSNGDFARKSVIIKRK